MDRRKFALLLAALVCAVSLAGCGKEGAVYVQSVKSLVGYGAIAPSDRFACIVISEDVTKIEKDADKTVAELFVKEGDDVKEGQKLFCYDTEELQLSLDKQRLEAEQLQTSIESFQLQIDALEKSLSSVSGSTKLQYTIEIQSTQVDLKEAQLKLKTKEAEVKKSEKLLENAEVTSPVTGRIQSVNTDGQTDHNGNPLPFISIQKSGAFRIKGTLGELQSSAIRAGDRLTILSRTDGRTWSGTVTLVDFENPTQGSQTDGMMGPSPDEMSASSRYPFYADIDNMEGLLLGQHVYVQLEQGEQPQGLFISPEFIVYREDGAACVWAEERGRLTQRTVELGAFNDRTGTQQILSGLTEDDYIAVPDPGVCAEGAPVTREALQASPQETEGA